MTIPELRKAAIISLGLGKEVNGKVIVNGAKFDGSPASYSALSAGDQIALTDRMAAMIAADPANFSRQQVAVANSRVNSPFYRQPLAATSYINVTAELIKSGEFQKSIMGGITDYLKSTSGVALLITAIGLTAALASLRNSSPSRY